MLQLKGVPAVRVIRRESGTMKGSAAAGYVAGLVSLAALLMWQAGDLVMGSYVIGGFPGAGVGFFAVAWAALRLVTNRKFIFLVGSRNVVLRHGLANLRRHARGNAGQNASLPPRLTAVP